jgi:hypothetical protein
MPHVREAIPASHDRHDTLLVAALAAGDLAGTDRDQALAQTASCAECAALHADLVAIATATATLPPPIAASGRDFRLTPAQAASLRRTGWRRFLPTGGFRPLSRPLGVALATFGIAGLLIGTQPLQLGGGAATSAGSAMPAEIQSLGGAAAPATNDQAVQPAASAAASAAAVAPVPAAASAAASMAPGTGTGFGADASGGLPGASGAPVRAASGGGTVAGPIRSVGPSVRAENGATNGPSAETKDGLFGTAPPASTSTSPSPLVLVSLGAIVVGVVLLVTSFRSRRTSL